MIFYTQNSTLTFSIYRITFTNGTHFTGILYQNTFHKTSIHKTPSKGLVFIEHPPDGFYAQNTFHRPSINKLPSTGLFSTRRMPFTDLQYTEYLLQVLYTQNTTY